MRKTLLIGAIVVVVLGIVGGVWFFFFRTTPAVTVAPSGGTTLPSSGQAQPDIPIATTSPATSNPVAVSARLVKVSAGPVVPGVVVVNSGVASASSSVETSISYIERQSGNVYTYSLANRVATRINNKTLPGIQSAAWLPNGSLAFVRYLSGTDFSTINTYALPAAGGGGFFLPQNLAGVAVSSTSLLTLAVGISGSAASRVGVDGTGAVPVFTSPLSSLSATFAGRDQYLVTTKAASSLVGAAFLVDGTGRFSRVAGPLPGLTALASPSGKWVLVSSSSGGSLQLRLVNTATMESLSLPVSTLTEKCVWSSDETAVYCGVPMNPSVGVSYPDDWYQGAVSFSDRIWKISVVGRYAELVLDFSKETESSLDAIALALDPLSLTLAFVNKNDGSLWSFSL
ncbi:MAG: hypothetical protein AAB442_01050 [Patescibacteria group bacterium]